MKKFLSSCLLTILLLAGCGKSSQRENKINILWLTCEDISPTLSFYGDSTAHTPNLDRLASESLIFENAFSTVGVCAPSRSSIITGMYPTSIGSHNMRTGKDVMGWGQRTYDQKSSGYDINGQKVPHYSVVVPSPVKCFPEYLRAAGYYTTNAFKTDYQFASPVTAWDANAFEAHWRNRNDQQPFFAVFNNNITHESQIWKNRKLEMTVDPDAAPLPPYFPDNPVIRQDVARNYSNIELLDQIVGERLRELEEAGLMDKTIIFFYSDHGGPLPRGKRESYVSGLRVPLLVRLPRGTATGRINDLISFVDLAPTVLSLAGVKPPDYMQGQAFLGKYKSEKKREFVFGSGDRFDEFSDRIRSVTNDKYVYVKNFHTKLPAYKDIGYRKNMDMMNELLRLKESGKLNDNQKYWFRTGKAEEEFYDRKADPHQLHNIVDDPELSGQVERFRAALQGWQEQTNDLGGIPESDLLNKMWPEGIQPATQKPTAKSVENTIEISCQTDNSSIAYIISEKDFEPTLDSGWQLYHKPIENQLDKYLYVMSNRIGFKDSEIIKIEM